MTSIDNKAITCVLFLDISKAFATVNHQILLSKLYKYGISGTLLLWFKDYLTNRYQYVKIGDIESEQLKIICAVPQGSTLVSLLFMPYINDMPNCSSKLSFRIFDNDTNIFYSNSSSDGIERVMNEELHYNIHYCRENKLSINYTKTNYMSITSAKKKMRNICINNTEEKLYIKYLGIYIDNKLHWIQQINMFIKKLLEILGF